MDKLFWARGEDFDSFIFGYLNAGSNFKENEILRKDKKKEIDQNGLKVMRYWIDNRRKMKNTLRWQNEEIKRKKWNPMKMQSHQQMYIIWRKYKLWIMSILFLKYW